VIQFHNKNQRNAQFSKLMFNLLCLLYVSKLIVSSSGRQLYKQCGVFYMYQCEQSGGQESTFEGFQF
jgi:hypothetical protein